MLSVASVLLALTGVGVLAFMPLPKQRKERLMQQALGATLFAVGLAGFVAVVFVKGQLIG
jgi:hypothetical protein